MQRAMELARLGLGTVSPNPLVGCLVVSDDRIISEGWHKKFGGPHAEVNALAQVEDLSILARSTVYVNLEPCSHVGKTPPCADLLIEKGVKRVVIANRDTHEKVAGRGIERLRAAGVDVTEGVLEKEGRNLNRRFFAWAEQGIPYVILKWAESADGFIAGNDAKQVWISTPLSRQRVHQWRAEEDAVLVGTSTAAIDNPRLSVRDWTGRNPLRVVIDRSLRLPGTLNLFDQSQPTICYNLTKNESKGVVTYVRIEEENSILSMLNDLVHRNIGSVLVEGGAKMLQAFLDSGYWHEARVFKAPHSLHQGITAPLFRGVLQSEESVSGDRFFIYRNPAR